MSVGAGKKPVLALLVPDGVGVRNFVHGKFLQHAKEHFEPKALSSISRIRSTQ